MHILCTGDVHIGRHARRLPADADRGVTSAGHMWQAIVDAAIARQVSVVLLAGDVVERADRFAGAIGPLEQGLRRLAAHQIPVVAVCGNHDFDILPKLAAQFDPGQFRLLGSGGRWERHVLTVRGNERLCVDGWSFPDRHVPADPLELYDLGPPPPGVPAIGLLHGDLDEAESRYAPFSLAGLLQHPHVWVLGHWHNPVQWNDGQRLRLLYPGSPLALNPKEPGSHGPWLLTIGAGGTATAVQLPLSTTRFESVTVDITGAKTLDEVDQSIRHSAAAKLTETVDLHGEALRYLQLRLRIVGSTPLHDEWPRVLGQRLDELRLWAGRAVASVERWTVATTPATAHDRCLISGANSRL